MPLMPRPAPCSSGRPRRPRPRCPGRAPAQAAPLLTCLAHLLQAQGNYAAARPYLEQALAIQEHAAGATPAQVATSLDNLAALLYTQGDYAAARPLYERALALREEAC